MYLSRLITHTPPVPLESRPSQELLSLPQMGRDLSLGLWDMAFPLQGTFLPQRPPPALIRQVPTWKPLLPGRLLLPLPPRSTHTLPKVWAMCLPITPHTAVSQDVAVSPDSLHAL